MHKAILLLLLMANLINSANLVAKEVRENEIQTNSYMENPDFNYSVKQKIVNLKGDYSFLNNNSQYVVSNAIASVKDKDSSTFITSLEAKYSKNLNVIEFLNSPLVWPETCFTTPNISPKLPSLRVSFSSNSAKVFSF